jgi:large subunit ribosomal protein L25
MDAVLDAVIRTTRGKNAARRLRAGGRIPAVVYGAQKEGDDGRGLVVAVDPKALMRILHSGSGVNTLITFRVDGEPDSRVIVKEFTLDPVTGGLVHADFFRVNMDRRIRVTVQVAARGEARGVKAEGGLLEILHREIEVECLPAQIPDAIEVDVTNLGLNDAVHVRDVAAGAMWTPVSDPDMMLLHVVMPRAAVEPAPAEAAAAPAAPAPAAEPEVIKKGKTDKEGEEPAARDKKDKKPS